MPSGSRATPMFKQIKTRIIGKQSVLAFQTNQPKNQYHNDNGEESRPCQAIPVKNDEHFCYHWHDMD